MNSRQIEKLRREAILTKYKTIEEKKAFLEGYIACLEYEVKRRLEGEEVNA